jgi:hypothetical protein
MSIIQDLIPEVIPSQKCHMNMGPIPKGYEATDIWCACTHSNRSLLLLAQCVFAFAFSKERLWADMHSIYSFCNSNTDVALEEHQ